MSNSHHLGFMQKNLKKLKILQSINIWAKFPPPPPCTHLCTHPGAMVSSLGHRKLGFHQKLCRSVQYVLRYFVNGHTDRHTHAHIEKHKVRNPAHA